MSYRADGLPAGGTCGNAECHGEQHEEWKGSVHDLAQVECRACHGGIDTAPSAALIERFRAWTREPGAAEDADPAAAERRAAEAYAHLGVKQKKSGEPVRPARGEIAALCGACHENVFTVFSPLHHDRNPEESPKKTCFQCHSNHAVKDPGEWLYEKGYTDPADPRTKPFLAARDTFAGLERELAAGEASRESLVKRGYPAAGLKEALEAARKQLAESRPLVHALDEEALAKKTVPIREQLAAARAEAERPLGARDERWKLVAGVWAAVIALNALIWRKLRSLPKAQPGGA